MLHWALPGRLSRTAKDTLQGRGAKGSAVGVLLRPVHTVFLRVNEAQKDLIVSNNDLGVLGDADHVEKSRHQAVGIHKLHQAPFGVVA